MNKPAQLDMGFVDIDLFTSMQARIGDYGETRRLHFHICDLIFFYFQFSHVVAPKV